MCLSVPCRTSTPHTSFKPRQGDGYKFVHCHVSYGSRPYLLAEAGSSAATCPTASDPASLLKRAPMLPCVTRLRTSPPCSGGLRCCHVSHSSGPCLPALEGSGSATCPTAPDHAFLLRRAPALSRVLRPSKKGLADIPMRLGVRPKNLQTFKTV
jgi:hypothetical protein